MDLPARPGSRRTTRSVLVAAAVAAVAGLGAVQVLDPLGGRTESVESAAGSGDDAIVERVAAIGPAARVVTADRGLVARIEELGATALGPRTLLDLLDSAAPTTPPAARE